MFGEEADQRLDRLTEALRFNVPWRTTIRSNLDDQRLGMARDKQLANVNLGDVLEKRRLDQALNAKEFAVLAGVSYSTAREWFRLSGFPTIRSVVFWSDFTAWRRSQAGLESSKPKATAASAEELPRSITKPAFRFPRRAARILTEAG